MCLFSDSTAIVIRVFSQGVFFFNWERILMAQYLER